MLRNTLTRRADCRVTGRLVLNCNQQLFNIDFFFPPVASFLSRSDAVP